MYTEWAVQKVALWRRVLPCELDDLPEDEVVAWAERLENHSAIGQCCEDLGEIEIAKGNKSAGLEMLKHAREEYAFENFEKTLPHVWQNINKRIKELGG